MKGRSAGILLHITSLPGPHGSGDLGPGAHAFVDFLAAAGCAWWQVLPVSPTGAGYSPYSGTSAFAGNPLLVDLAALARDGLLDGVDLRAEPAGDRADLEAVTVFRAGVLRQAAAMFVQLGRARGPEWDEHRARHRAWLPDYALFMALRDRHGAPWTRWPERLAQRDDAALAEARTALDAECRLYEVEQLFFERQWTALRAHCRDRGIGLIGDAPIFVSHDSADVWANQPIFRLDARGEPTHVAGVPPDYFSKTGQRWGNPLYRWKRLRREGYGWWIARFRRLAELFDVVRLDHFIGFARYWEIAAAQETAEHGRYLKGPGRDLFDAVRAALGGLPLIAEDLGSVTPAVTRLRDEMGIPGMRVLQFAFGTDAQAEAFRPHGFVRNTVAYTGTHDNDTIVGWLDDEGAEGGPRSPAQAARERGAALRYLTGSDARPPEPHWAFIRTLYASVANTVIVPLQDVLGLGNEARMNVPGSPAGNWGWRVQSAQLTPAIAERLRQYAEIYGRELSADSS